MPHPEIAVRDTPRTRTRLMNVIKALKRDTTTAATVRRTKTSK